MTSEQNKQIIQAAYDECVCIGGKVAILDVIPEINFAKDGGYWVQAWIHVEARPPAILKHDCAVVRSIP